MNEFAKANYRKRTARVVVIVPVFPKASETFIVNKFLGLLERGWGVHVVCNSSDPNEWRQFPRLLRHPEARKRIHVNWPHQPRWLAALLLPLVLLRCLFINPRGAWRYLTRGGVQVGLGVFRRLYLDAEILCTQPALVHFEFGTLAADRMYLPQWLGSKALVSFRGFDLNFVALDRPTYYQEVWDKADALHLLGEALWQRAQQRGCPGEKWHALIPPAIDTEFFDPGNRRHRDVAGSTQRPLRILSVGRLEWKKGYEFALQAVSTLRQRGIHCEYRILGDGTYLEAVAYARHQLGLDETVCLLGSVPSGKVKEHMAWADLLLHAAVSEGFCNAVIEAQAMALPVVCSDADGLAENIEDGQTGFVVPRRNVPALAEKLQLLAEQPLLRQRLGANGRRRVIAKFQMKDQIAAFENLYQNLLQASLALEESPHSTPTPAPVNEVAGYR